MGEHQPLPVAVEHIFAAVRLKYEPASRLSRFKQKVHLGVMAERFKMSHALHRTCNGLLVYNPSGAKCDLHTVALTDQFAQNLDLNFPHHLHLDLS